MLTVEVRDVDLVTVGAVDNFTTLTLTQTWMAVGVWVLEVPTDAPEVSLLLTPGAGIVVRDGVDVLFAGPVDAGPTGFNAVRRELAATDSGQTDTTTVTGADDMVVLADRVCHPSPVDGNPATQGYDIRTGPASTVLWSYIHDNAADGAVTARQTPYLTMAPDPGVGAVMTQQARWQNLLEFLAEVATQGGMTVTVTQVGRQLVAAVTAQIDRTGDVVFSPAYGDLADVVYEITRSTATAVYLGAQGDLAERAIGEAATPGVRRIEMFADRRDVADPTQITALAEAALADATGVTSLTVTPAATDAYRYGVDYSIGDLIGVDLDGIRLSAQVTRVTTVLDPGGMVRTIGVGDITTPVARLYTAIRGLSARLTQLERT